MKRFVAIFLVVVLSFTIAGCNKFDSDVYRSHLAGKIFHNDGRGLGFNNDSKGVMCYYYKNLMGVEYFYEYEPTGMKITDTEITITYKLVSVGEGDDTTAEDWKEEHVIIYNIIDDTVTYNGLVYEKIKG